MSISAEGPPPPLAGALAAWWARAGDPFVVATGALPSTGEVWVHLEGHPESLDHIRAGADLHFFGPGADDPARRDDVRRRFPAAEIVRGDPEPGMHDVGDLPITTWHGFPPPEGAVRILAGRGHRTRPLAALMREIVYLVETFEVGHLLFDDADLGVQAGWLGRFEKELKHLPWAITWEGNVDGDRRRGPGPTDC